MNQKRPTENRGAASHRVRAMRLKSPTPERSPSELWIFDLLAKCRDDEATHERSLCGQVPQEYAVARLTVTSPSCSACVDGIRSCHVDRLLRYDWANTSIIVATSIERRLPAIKRAERCGVCAFSTDVWCGGSVEILAHACAN